LSRKISILLVFCLIVASIFMAACNRKDQASNEPTVLQNPASPALEGSTIPRAQVTAFWVSFADSQIGVASSTDQAPISPELSMYSSFNSVLSYFYDPLDGSTLGIPNILGYGPGFLGQSAIFGGNHYYIQYGVGSQIPNSGPVEFYLNIPAYQPAYNGANIIFTQPGYGGAAAGDIHLALTANNSLAYGQWGPGWHYQYSPPLPMNQWVKIRAEFGSTGKNLYFNDQLVCSDPNFRLPISARPFFFGTRAFYGPEYGINGKLDEVISFTGTPVLKIVSPTSGTGFDYGQPITFVGEANPPLINNLQWSSSINGVFGQGLTATASNLSPGTHTITLSGQFRGSQVVDSITIVVQEIAEIKIKNLDAQIGEDPFELNVAVSYRAAKTKFQAIGCRADHSEIGPVLVDWSLSGGGVSEAESPARYGILNALGVIEKRIGNIDGVSGVSGKPSVTFNSFLSSGLSGPLTLSATKGGLQAKSVSIKINQPTVYIQTNLVANVAPILSLWLTRANQTWGRENIINVKMRPHQTKANELFAVDYNSSEQYLPRLTPPEDPALINPIVWDEYLKPLFGGLNIIPRQSLVLLGRPLPSKDVNAYVVDKIWLNAPTEFGFIIGIPLINKNGFAITQDDYFGRDLNRIYDPTESGLILPNKRSKSGLYPENHLRILAHELGHVILQTAEEHVSDSNNLMSRMSTGDDITSLQYLTALDYFKAKAPTSYFIVEE